MCRASTAGDNDAAQHLLTREGGVANGFSPAVLYIAAGRSTNRRDACQWWSPFLQIVASQNSRTVSFATTR